jgi:hypothetical protein
VHLSLNRIIGAGEFASPTRYGESGVLTGPLGNFNRRKNHAFRQVAVALKNQGLFPALTRGVRKANGKDQINQQDQSSSNILSPLAKLRLGTSSVN